MRVFCLFLLLTILAISGCGGTPILATIDGRTKQAFGIHEWAFESEHTTGLELKTVTETAQETVLTFGPSKQIRAIFLQNDPLADSLIFRIDAPGDGFYGSDLRGTIDVSTIKIYDYPKNKNGDWTIASGIFDSKPIELVVRMVGGSNEGLTVIRD